jgi:predicted amidohydrolase YtcJ
MCDLILFNANVITMDPAMPRATLVAIAGNRIVSVADSRAPMGLRPDKTKAIDCGGRTLVPGFVDAHCHIHAYAESLVSLNLSPREDIRSIAEIKSRILGCCKDLPPGTWIRGKNYNEFYLAEGRHPNRRDLDPAAPRHPVKLTHRSGHAHVLNSIALEHVGINMETGDPPGGFIDREPETGMPTGILYGMGEYLAGKIPQLHDDELERGLKLANERLLSFGITSVHDATAINGPEQWSRFEKWKTQKLLQVRLTAVVGAKNYAGPGRICSPARNGNVQTAGVKIIADEATGSLHPSQEDLNALVSSINGSGLQVVVHALEEPVIEAAVTAIIRALGQHPRRDHRHRIEHCSVCPPPLLRKIEGTGITVVTQPSFIYYNGDRYLKTVPAEQLENLYAISSMRAHNIPVGFGSDCPVADPNPLVGIFAAVTRMTEGGNTVSPAQRISVEDAIRMYTIGAAASFFQEGSRGSIAVGKFADLIMLNEDPLAAEPVRIKDIRVILTILDGRIAWSDGTL